LLKYRQIYRKQILEYRFRWSIEYRQLAKYQWKIWKYRYRFQKIDTGRSL